MNYKERYREWLNSKVITEEAKIDLRNIDLEAEIKDRFYKDLEFGTAGLRGKLGLGTNRMNIYTVAKAIQGLAQVIVNHGEEAMDRGVVIAHDVRHKSDVFQKLAAEILTANGIRVYVFDSIRSTPMVSFAIRELNTISGLMITASHNPKEYNGIKVYWEEGSQILDNIGNEILNETKNIKKLSQISKIKLEEAEKQGLLIHLDETIDLKYKENVLALKITDEIDKDLKIVYTPLNGTGSIPVQEILGERGFKNLYIVEPQAYPDPDFTTVGYPNPEYTEAFEYSIRLGREVDADILIATDPDADRVAAMVKDGHEYKAINGNQMGALLVNYILSLRTRLGNLPENPAIVKSIVTGDLSKVIADRYGVESFETLTGFKNICGKANEFERTLENQFIFGFEESIGYVYGTFVRDKDAISTSMLIAEMAAYYKTKGKNLLDVLEDIYKEYGYYLESLFSFELKGIEGSKRIERIMEDIRNNPISIEGMEIERIIDYLNDETGNPKSNVLKCYLKDGSWFAIRPSGTEPKIKIYIYSSGTTEEESLAKIEDIEAAVENRIAKVE